jgi:hypothetical protein
LEASTQASLFDDMEMDSPSESCERAISALPFAIALIPYAFPDPVDLKAHYLPGPDGLEGDGNVDAWEGLDGKEADP